MSLQDTAVEKRFAHTGIIGLDEILGGQPGNDSIIRGRLRGERILIVGPPGSGKTILALSLMYKVLRDSPPEERGLFLTTDQSADRLTGSISGLFPADFDALIAQPNSRLDIKDFPPYNPPRSSPSDVLANDQELVVNMLDRLTSWTHERTHEASPPPRHVVLDGITAMQSVLSSQAEARRLTHMILGRLSFPKDSFDLIIATAEAHGLSDFFDDYLFDTVIDLDVIETPAARRLRTIEISKSRGRHARTGRHTLSLASKDGLPLLIRSSAAQAEIDAYGTPVIIFPREPRGERPVETGAAQALTSVKYLQTGTSGLDRLLDSDGQRGLLRGSTTLLVGGPGTGASLIGLRYLARGLETEADLPVLLVSFGRTLEDFARLGNNFPWMRAALRNSLQAFHFLYYRPVNLDQNRLFYEIRKEIETYCIDRVVIDSISSLPMVDVESESSSDFLVTFMGLLKELHCTTMFSYSTDRPPEPFSAPGRFIPSLVDNILVLRNSRSSEEEMEKKIAVLKARGTTAVNVEAEFHIGHDLEIVLSDL